MKRLLVSIAAAALFVGCSDASGSDAEAAGELSASSAQLFQGNAERDFVEAMERSMEASMLLYARGVPGGEDRLEPISFDNEDREVFRCAIDAMRREGLGDYLDEAADLNLQLAQYIEDTPELSLMTLESDPQFEGITQELTEMADGRMAEMASINIECGVAQLTQEKLDESGASAMLMELMTMDDG